MATMRSEMIIVKTKMRMRMKSKMIIMMTMSNLLLISATWLRSRSVLPWKKKPARSSKRFNASPPSSLTSLSPLSLTVSLTKTLTRWKWTWFQRKSADLSPKRVATKSPKRHVSTSRLSRSSWQKFPRNYLWVDVVGAEVWNSGQEYLQPGHPVNVPAGPEGEDRGGNWGGALLSEHFTLRCCMTNNIMTSPTDQSSPPSRCALWRRWRSAQWSQWRSAARSPRRTVKLSRMRFTSVLAQIYLLVLCIVICLFFCRSALPSRGKCALMSQSRSAGKTFWW